MSIIESLQAFFAQCPLLQEGRVAVDLLGKEPQGYSIEPDPVPETVRRYADGGAMYSYAFTFAGREYFGPGNRGRMERSAFYEAFSAWLEENGKEIVLPEGKQAQEITALQEGYRLETDGKYARYEIQCRLIYYERGKSR